MRYPSFIAEMALPAHRKKLYWSVRSGYSLVGAFLLLGLAADAAGIVPFQRGFCVLLALKLATNTLAVVALRSGVLALEACGLNVLMDLVAMTGIIHYTGGETSPLFPIYVIEITVVALLSNLGTTVLVAGAAILLYGAMALMVHGGVLDAWPSPVAIAGGVTRTYLAFDLAFAAFVLGVPTFFSARILKELREKQRALEARTEALVEAQRQKSQFMANVTHELRTPIHGICGLSDLLDAGIYGPVTAKQREAQQGIKRSARSLLQLIDDLLEVARADAGKVAFRPEQVDIAELVPNVVSSARWMLGTKPVELTTEVAEGLPTVFTDPRRLTQVVLNLLANAVKFTPDGGHVRVTARRDGDGDGVAIVVADDGVGIPAEEQPRIFDEFRQVDGSAERRFGGIGLGLALVKRLTDGMGATVTVVSEEGKGATFTVRVPRTLPASAEHAA